MLEEKGAVEPVEELDETAEEALDEMVEEIVEGKEVEEAQDETDTEEEASDSEEESDEKEEVEEEEGEEEEEFSLEDLASEGIPEAEDNVQKRIDKLTRDKYTKDARIAELEAKLATKDTSQRSKYTEDQLDLAEAKALEEGDKSLLKEVRKERRKNMLADVKEELGREQKVAQEQAVAVQKEAQQVVETFGYLKDEDSRLNIQDKESLLYKLALVLYQNPSYAERYQVLGGQMLCVSDAVKILRKKGLGKKKSKSEKALEKKVKKLKKTTSVKGSKSVKADPKKRKPRTQKEQKSDYMKEREAAKQKLMGL